ncbi:hypothetical protein E2C01_051932 [Portunus trituberculatus]|uniref:Uncharacterized protein n=1 Tax=Portunus trituberculatus TaxID=210409 RepID=A0A5B7GCB1_PORTR|nr:hypothetical protein [Portunus trituberculatus]
MKIGPHVAYEVQKWGNTFLTGRSQLQKGDGKLAWELKDFGPPYCHQAQGLVGQPQQKPPE